MHSSQEDSLCPPPIPFPTERRHRDTHLSVCRAGSPWCQPCSAPARTVTAAVPYPTPVAFSWGTALPGTALVLPASPFTAAFHLPLRTEKGPSPPGRALRMPSPRPTSQACSPRALRHRPRLNKTQSTASKKAFSVSPTRHYILHSRPASTAHTFLSQHKYMEFLFNRTVTHF